MTLKHTPINTVEHECFDIHEYWFGFQSYGKDGRPIIRSHTLTDCELWTDKYLKAQQDGGWSLGRVVNDGKVGGKL